MSYSYVAIEREYGSGGTEIARRLAEKMGMACYGREIIEKVAALHGIPVKQIDKYEETVSNSFLYSVFMMSRAQSGDSNLLCPDGQIFLAEQDVIRKMAAEGPAVFIGHCAAEALKKHRSVLRVFIYSDEADRKSRIMNEYDIPDGKVTEAMHKFDKKRANYYYANTGDKWHDFCNYDLIINSGSLGTERAVEMLAWLLNK